MAMSRRRGRAAVWPGAATLAMAILAMAVLAAAVGAGSDARAQTGGAQVGGAMAIAERPATGPEGCDIGEIRIRFSHVVVERGHPKGEAASALAAAVNRELNGQACMIVYPDSTLFNDNEVLDRMLAGEVEMAAPSLSKLDPYTRAFRVFDLPFLFRDFDSLEWFQNSGPGMRLRRTLTPMGLKALGFWNNGLKQLSATRPLMAPDDARGLTFRIQNSDVLRTQFRVLGAQTREMPFSEVAGALQEGRVDGQENTWSNILSKEFYRFQDGVTESNHGVLAYLVVTSDAFWSELSPDLRRRLAQLITRSALDANRAARRIAAEAREELELRGVPIRTLDEAQRAAWIAAMEPVWSRFEAQVGADYIAAAVMANR